MTEFSDILQKISTVDKNVGIAVNEMENIRKKLCDHVDSCADHKKDYYTWRRTVDLEIEKSLKECPVKEKVGELDKDKISKKSAYRTAGLVLLTIGIIEGVIQFFKGD